MKKSLYCGIDLHSSNAVYVIADSSDKVLLKKRLPNDLSTTLATLKPFRKQLATVVVESTYNWYWLVDGLMEAGYPVKLANPAAIVQYDGIKQANDLTDAAFLAHLARLNILPTGYIYPKEERALRDLLRRRLLLVRQKTLHHMSLQSMIARHSGQRLCANEIKALETKQLADFLPPPILLGGQITHQARCWMDTAIKRIERELQKRVQPRMDYQLLQSIPGVGPALGTTIALETGTIQRFSGPGNYASYAQIGRAHV